MVYGTETNMKNISVVIGTNYGDEGKGIITDYLSSAYGKNTAVVRFNGGAQAGHTVVLPKTHFRHVFQHLGSGTLSGCPTILARDFIVNPLAFWSEVFDLTSKLKKDNIEFQLPHVYIDPNCIVTTPFEMEINKQLELSRGDKRHGSCGLGIGETVERQERGISLRIGDLLNESADPASELMRIQFEYYEPRMEELGLEPVDLDPGILEQFCKDARDIVRVATVVPDHTIIPEFENIVFEGAQGLCLDINSRDFPHVTRSDTGLKNVAYILNDVRDEYTGMFDIDVDIDVHYVSRIYNTRHGAGPLKDEIPFDEFTAITHIKDRTNVLNEHQGQLRYATHDFARMHADVYEDLEHFEQFNYVTTACVTHCDQVGQVYNDTSVTDIVNTIKSAIDSSQLIVSFGRTRAHVLKLDNLELD